MTMWKTTFIYEVDEKGEAELMVKALEKMSPKPNDIIGMIKRNFDL